jgi:hypothetical protein
MLGADLVVSGELLHFGAGLKLNLKLHDTREGRLIAMAQAGGQTAEDIDAAARPTISRLFASFRKPAANRKVAAARVTADYFRQIFGLRLAFGKERGVGEEKVVAVFGQPVKRDVEWTFVILRYPNFSFHIEERRGLVSMNVEAAGAIRSASTSGDTRLLDLIGASEEEIAGILPPLKRWPEGYASVSETDLPIDGGGSVHLQVLARSGVVSELTVQTKE